ncbi:FCD domain-containing protein [Mesorhizobium sp. 113-3-9]
MIALDIAGLVEIRTGSGIYVRHDLPPKGDDSVAAPSMSQRDAGPFEILTARMTIEPHVAAEAARNATAEDIAALWRIIEKMKEPTDPRTGLERDREFHFLVACATKNMTLARIVDELWSHHFTPMHSGISTLTGLFHTDAMDISDHTEIVRHIEARSVVAARKSMKAHLNHVRAILLKA